MTTTTNTGPRPPGIRTLPDAEHVACKACGTPCGPDAPRTTMHVIARADELGVREASTEATFAMCERCANLDAHAARVLDAHPAIRDRIGSPNIGRHRIVSAFHGFAVMGTEPAETYTAAALL